MPCDLIYMPTHIIYALEGGTVFSKKKYIKRFYVIVTISEDALVRHKSIAFGPGRRALKNGTLRLYHYIKIIVQSSL